jgi:hypothetical protein
VAGQLDVCLRADALVLHSYRVVRVAFDPRRHCGLSDGEVCQLAVLCISCSLK